MSVQQVECVLGSEASLVVFLRGRSGSGMAIAGLYGRWQREQ